MSDFTDYQPGTLYFVPLGGSGEFGCNLNLYRYNGQWLMVDLGISFHGKDQPPGTMIMPDLAALKGQRKQIAGLIITHAHEDHIGAVAYLWDQLRCPVYATPFAAAFLRAKLRDNHIEDNIDLIEIDFGQRFYVGHYHCRALPVTHSVPESMMLEITTPVGRIIHTGDWKDDRAPATGEVNDLQTLQTLGDDGVLMVVSDSTNANLPGRSGDELSVQEGLTSLFARLHQRIFITCFASNVGRIKSIARAAQANGRRVILAGRSLWRFNSIARELGYFDDTPKFDGPEALRKYSRAETVVICTGSQGEPLAALSRIAMGQHPKIAGAPGDHAVFSARIIPGNELEIATLKDNLRQRGYAVLAPDDVPELIYASGHPNAEEVCDLYRALRPRIVLPVHGTPMHQQANEQLAKACGVTHTLCPVNSGVYQISADGVLQVGTVASGKVYQYEEQT